MDVKFNVKFKFKVNGKEYGSLDEMPADIRKTYEKAMGKSKGLEQGNISSLSKQKIVFNGQEYEGISSMPPEIRQIYETVMTQVEEGKIAATGNAGSQCTTVTPGIKNEGIMTGTDFSKPIEPKSTFSAKFFVTAVAVIALVVGIYILMTLNGAK